MSVCSHRAPTALFGAGHMAGVLKADFESEPYYGAGWSGAERNEAGVLRRVEDRATLLLPLEKGFTYHAWLALSSSQEERVSLALDGAAIGTCDIRRGAECELTVPASLVSNGVSALTLERSGAPSQRHGPVLFRGARLTRQPDREPPLGR